ncbi:MAG: hypothetical protein KF746_02530 [Chitinophagaceae bacterium]|nr:hypothetical protein [Chitinophagaceae bacterium]
MKKILTLGLILYGVNANAQGFIKNVLERSSIEAFGGFANYQGELQDKMYTFAQAKPAFSLGGSVAITDKFWVRGLATLGRLHASDKYSSNASKKNRNLDFYSRLYDASLTLGYDLFNLSEKRYTPYVFAGASLYHFSPYTYDTSGGRRWLVGYRTEGQGLTGFPDRKVYALNQLSIPFGGGIKFAVNQNISIGWEFRFNKTFTDYLDDVSTTYIDRAALQAAKGNKAVELAYRGGEVNHANTYPAAGTPRGNPKTKDWYYFSGITVSYSLFGRPENYNTGGGKGSRSLGCPKNIY